MTPRRWALAALAVVVLTPLLAPAQSGGGHAYAAGEASSYGRLPLHFEENRGQTDSEVRFLARGRGYTALLTPTEAFFALRSADGPRWDDDSTDTDAESRGFSTEVLRMQFPGANPTPLITGRDEMAGKSNYFVGNDPTKWVTGAAHFGRVVVQDLYPGVDLHWRGSPRRRLAYEFVVAPDADPTAITIEFEGAERVVIGEGAGLRVSTERGELLHSKPVLYQEANGQRTSIDGRFVLRPGGRVGFDVGSYDPRQPLVIDPELTYSTYLGGSGTDNPLGVEMGIAIAVDGKGSAYVGGRTPSVDFPLKSPVQGTHKGKNDAFVSKLNAKGSALVYSTFLGGSGDDDVHSIAVDGVGAAYVTGHTASSGFPTKSALQPTFGGVADAFVAKLNAAGSALVYSTYLGSSGHDVGRGIAIDGSGAAYLVGFTGSTSFPTKSPMQATNAGSGDAFVSKISSSGASLVYSTYLGGSGTDDVRCVAVDSGGAAYVTGMTASTDFSTKSPLQASHGGGTNDVFVSKLNSAGSALVYSTYLGGSGNDKTHLGALAVDSTGALYLCGSTTSTDFPTQSPLQATHGGAKNDVFVSKINATGSSLVYSTYLGGSSGDVGHALAVDRAGAASVTGLTRSTDFPTKSPLQAANGGAIDAFVSKLNAAGAALVYSTYLGGSADDRGFGIAIDPNGSAYVSGATTSTDFPTKGPIQATHGGGNYDAWVAKIAATIPQKPTNLTVTGSTEQQVDLAWTDKSTDETKFELERATEAGPFAALTDLAADKTTHGDATVAADTTYTYRVRATNAVGPSAWSNTVTAATLAAPSDLLATPFSNTRVDLLWRDNSTGETGFEIERKVAGTATFVLVRTVATDVTALADGGVAPEKTYVYRVRAIKGAGPSSYTDEVTVTTPPADPSSVLPQPTTDTSVRLRWQDVSDAESGYEIQRGVGCPPTDWNLLATVGADVTEYFDLTAQPETTYGYRIRAINEHGNSEWTPVVCITTPPAAPSDLLAQPLSPSRIRVTWTENSKVEAGLVVRRALASDGLLLVIATLPPDTTLHLDTTASQETDYYYDVASFDDNGHSARVLSEKLTTPAALIIRRATIKRGKPGAKKAKASKLAASGEFDVGGAGIDLAGAATLGIGPGSVAIDGFERKGKGLRYQDDQIRLDLKPGKGSSRVSFKLTAQGTLVDALVADGEMTLSFGNGDYRAMGTVGLAGDKFQPGKVGEWIDPAFILLSLRAKLKGSKGALTIKAAFHDEDGIPDAAPEVVVKLGFFEFTAKANQFTKTGGRWLFSQKAIGTRKITLDYKKGQVSVALKGVDLGSYEKGTVPVRISVDYEGVHFEDTPDVASSGKSLKY